MDALTLLHRLSELLLRGGEVGGGGVARGGNVRLRRLLDGRQRRLGMIESRANVRELRRRRLCRRRRRNEARARLFKLESRRGIFVGRVGGGGVLRERGILRGGQRGVSLRDGSFERRFHLFARRVRRRNLRRRGFLRGGEFNHRRLCLGHRRGHHRVAIGVVVGGGACAGAKRLHLHRQSSHLRVFLSHLRLELLFVALDALTLLHRLSELFPHGREFRLGGGVVSPRAARVSAKRLHLRSESRELGVPLGENHIQLCLVLLDALSLFDNLGELVEGGGEI